MKIKSILPLPIYYLLLISGVLVSLSIMNASISNLLHTKHQLAAYGAEQYPITLLLLNLVREIIPLNIGIFLSITLPIMTSMGNRFISKNWNDQKELFIFYDYINILTVASLLLLLGILTGLISCIIVAQIDTITFSAIFRSLDAIDILILILKSFVFSSLLFPIHKLQFSLLGKKKRKAKKVIISIGTVIVGFLGVLISNAILTKIFFNLNI